MFKFYILICMAWFLAGLAGCTRADVAHLKPSPLELEQEEEFRMSHWKFEYVSKEDNGAYQVKGKAYLKNERLPGIGDWIHRLRLSVQLSDEQGQVLAGDSRSYPTMKREPATAVPFEFRIYPEKMPEEADSYLSFGYRMRVSDSRYHDGAYESPLFGETSSYRISEGPLIR